MQRRMEFIGLGPRLTAALLDGIILGLPAIILTSMFAVPIIFGVDAVDKIDQRDPATVYFFFTKAVYLELVIVGLFATLMAFCSTTRLKTTPGKKIMGLKVITASGRDLNFSRAFLRYVSLPLMCLTIQTPERFVMTNKFSEALNRPEIAGDSQKFSEFIASPITPITTLLTLVMVIWWIMKVSRTPEKTAIHDLLFETRVVKA